MSLIIELVGIGVAIGLSVYYENVIPLFICSVIILFIWAFKPKKRDSKRIAPDPVNDTKEVIHKASVDKAKVVTEVETTADMEIIQDNESPINIYSPEYQKPNDASIKAAREEAIKTGMVYLFVDKDRFMDCKDCDDALALFKTLMPRFKNNGGLGQIIYMFENPELTMKLGVKIYPSVLVSKFASGSVDVLNEVLHAKKLLDIIEGVDVPDAPVPSKEIIISTDVQAARDDASDEMYLFVDEKCDTCSEVMDLYLEILPTLDTIGSTSHIIDTNKSPDIARKFGITSVPTMLVDGAIKVGKAALVPELKNLKETLNAIMAKMPTEGVSKEAQFARDATSRMYLFMNYDDHSSDDLLKMTSALNSIAHLLARIGLSVTHIDYATDKNTALKYGIKETPAIMFQGSVEYGYDNVINSINEIKNILSK